MRVPWVALSLLIVLAFLASLTYPAWGTNSTQPAAQYFETVFGFLGWICVLGSLIVGALGLWARAPATLATALGIVGAGAFMAMWMTQFIERGDDAGLHLGMVIAFTGVLVAFSAAARKPA